MNNKRHKGQQSKAFEEIIQKQQEEIERLKRTNDTLKESVDDWQSKVGAKDFIIELKGKESDQYLMTAKYLNIIYLLMDALDKILADNCTMGVLVKQAMLDFKKQLSEGMLQFVYDGDNVTFEPNNMTLDIWNNE